MRLSGNDLLFFAKRTHLETLAIEFIDENGGGPGVRLRKRHATAGSLIFTGYCPKTPSGACARTSPKC